MGNGCNSCWRRYVPQQFQWRPTEHFSFFWFLIAQMQYEMLMQVSEYCKNVSFLLILVHNNLTNKHASSQKTNIKSDVTVCISHFLRLFTYELALVWPCLDITSLERNAPRPIAGQLPPNCVFSPPHSAAGSHDLSLVPDMTCGLGLEADGASVPLCCFRSRVQQFSGFRKSSSRGAVLQQKVALIASQRGKKITLGTFKDGGQRSNSKLTIYTNEMNFEEGTS